MKLPITRLTDTLWTGGDLPAGVGLADELNRWRAEGIGVIVDCRVEWSDEDAVTALAPEMRYEHHGIDDIGQHVDASWFDRVAAAARPRTDDQRPGVLVHCHMGINRGPSGAYALLLAAGHDPVAAIELIRTRRPSAGVAYAEDALAWWHDRGRVPRADREAQQRALRAWRRANRVRTIRLMRGS